MAADGIFTPDHVAKLRSVTAAEISPDGRSVAYLLSVPRRPYEDENGPAWTELHVVDTQGNSRPFVTGQVSVGFARWTPDGEGISFLAKRGKDKHRSLYVIPLTGGEARRVLSHKTDITSYDWSPTGTQVAFLARDEAPKGKKKKLKDKGFNQEIYEEELRRVRVWIGTPDDEEAESRMLNLEGSASELHWSPAGEDLVVALAPTPLIDDHYVSRKIHVVDVATGTAYVRFNNPGKLGTIVWSPNGKTLAVLNAASRSDPAAGGLLVMPAGRNELNFLLPSYQGHFKSIAWRDNDTLVYLVDEGVWTALGEIKVSTFRYKTRIPAGQDVLSGLKLAADRQTTVMLKQSDKHPNEVFLLRAGESTPRRLTDSNPWLRDMRFGEQELVTFAARDDLRIEGILIHPLDREPGKPYPLILFVHGRPESHHHNGWLTSYSSPGQVAAARGFGVFHINYRGSTGRGVKFSKLSQGDYAGAEFDDLIDGVDHLIQSGLVDGDRVGVTGGSYGGYATAWCSTFYSERFKAGVMFVGISDLISKGGTTDIPEEMRWVHARKYVWEDWTLFTERSPIYHVEKARTPLLILGGKDDTRVHPSQSLVLYRYLKTLGKTPVRLVQYPGEGHGNRKAAARYDYSLRMLRWMEHYVKGPGGDPPPHEIDYGFGDDDDDDDDADDDDDGDND